MHHLVPRVCFVAKWTVSGKCLVRVGINLVIFIVLGPKFGRFGVKITVFGYAVT